MRLMKNDTYRVICIRDNIQGGVWKQFYLSRVLID